MDHNENFFQLRLKIDPRLCAPGTWRSKALNTHPVKQVTADNTYDLMWCSGREGKELKDLWDWERGECKINSVKGHILRLLCSSLQQVYLPADLGQPSPGTWRKVSGGRWIPLKESGLLSAGNLHLLSEHPVLVLWPVGNCYYPLPTHTDLRCFFHFRSITLGRCPPSFLLTCTLTHSYQEIWVSRVRRWECTGACAHAHAH